MLCNPVKQIESRIPPPAFKMGGKKSRSNSKSQKAVDSGPEETSAGSSSNPQSAPAVSPDSGEAKNPPPASPVIYPQLPPISAVAPDSQEAGNSEVVSSKTKDKAREETLAESSSTSQSSPSVSADSREAENPRPASPAIYPQLPSLSVVAPDSQVAGNSEGVLSNFKGKEPMRDLEELSDLPDAPPLPSSQQTTPPTESEEQPDRRRYIPPEDDWPPDWMDDQKEDTSPLAWPLDRTGWEKFLALSTKMASRKLNSDSLARAIASSGIWDVSHPKWKYENCWIHWHPDHITSRIEASKEAIAKSNGTRERLDSSLETEIIRKANEAWISKMPEWSTKS